MSLPLMMTPKQRKLRREWLTLVSLKFAAIPVFFIAFNFVMWQRDISIGSLIGALIGTGLFFYTFYFCAYKNPGIRVLTYSMVIGVINTHTEIRNFFDYDYTALGIGILVAYLSFEVWWFISSLKIRKLNREIKLYSSPEIISSTKQSG